MKKSLIAAALALTAAFASAAPTLTFDTDGTLAFDGKVNANESSFTHEFLFEVPYALSLLSSSVTTSLNVGKDIDFTSIYITNGSTTLYNFVQTSFDATSKSEQWSLSDASLASGTTYHLFLSGTSVGTVRYTGEMSVVSSVPEPSTWVLALAGLGAIGFVARRRQA